MPCTDGFDLARALRSDESVAGARLVLMTSLGQRGHGETARRIGIDAYLTKPVRQSQLFDSLTAVFRQYRASAAEPPTPTPPQTAMKETRPSSRAPILIAEDNVVNQRVALRQVEKLGYRADVVANGLEVLEALSRIPYGLVLMDCQMPEMDGYEATREIRRRAGAAARRTPVVAMTAHAMQGEREKCLRAGMDDYITKPVSTEVLAAAIECWILAPAPGTEVPTAEPPATQGREIRDVKSVAPYTAGISARLGSLREEFDAGLVCDLVGDFLSDGAERLAKLRQSVERADPLASAREAHGFKGSCANMGAEFMAGLCARLERQGRAGSVEDAPAIVAQLEE
ncbi:MAG: response regulator, partial [Pyrinomonadaceae bacterium]